jgi:hypothetical protein
MDEIETSDDESLGSLKDFIVNDEISSEKSASEASETLVDVVEPVDGTVVGGRMLRSRNPDQLEKRKPRDEYYERFGRKEEEKLLLQDTKKDIVKFVKTLEDEWKAKYEASGAKWPSLNVRMSLERIREEYQKIKDFAELPDSDDESDEEESIDDEADEDDESDDDDEDEDEDDESDDDDDADDEDTDDEDSEGEVDYGSEKD